MNNPLLEKKNLLASPKISLLDALLLLKKNGQKCIIVVNKKRQLLGTLTDGDVRSLIIKKKDLNQSISNLYNSNPRFIEENNFDINEIKKEILKFRYELIPIVNKSKKVVDVITWDQVFKKKLISKTKVKNCEAIIMAGGEGVRLEPFTSILPKPLIPIKGKSIIERIISNFSDFGINNFYISLGYKNNTIKAFFKALKLKNKIKFITENKPLGTIGSLSLIKKKISRKKTLLVSNCDILIKTDLAKILNYHLKKKNDFTIVAASKNFTIPYGVCKTFKDGSFKNISEKPTYNTLVNTGLYIIEPNLVNLIPNNKKVDINDFISLTQKKRKKIGVFAISDDSWMDIGQWNEYRSAVKKLGE